MLAKIEVWAFLGIIGNTWNDYLYEWLCDSWPWVQKSTNVKLFNFHVLMHWCHFQLLQTCHFWGAFFWSSSPIRMSCLFSLMKITPSFWYFTRRYIIFPQQIFTKLLCCSRRCPAWSLVLTGYGPSAIKLTSPTKLRGIDPKSQIKTICRAFSCWVATSVPI